MIPGPSTIFRDLCHGTTTRALTIASTAAVKPNQRAPLLFPIETEYPRTNHIIANTVPDAIIHRGGDVFLNVSSAQRTDRADNIIKRELIKLNHVLMPPTGLPFFPKLTKYAIPIHHIINRDTPSIVNSLLGFGF